MLTNDVSSLFISVDLFMLMNIYVYFCMYALFVFLNKVTEKKIIDSNCYLKQGKTFKFSEAIRGKKEREREGQTDNREKNEG